MFNVQTVVFWLCLSLTLCAFTQGEVRECKISSNRVLTTFSGETVTLTLPCKYRMADFTCGDYRVKVTPGNGVMTSDSSLTPVTVRANIYNTVTNARTELRTALKRLERGWKTVGGSDVGLDYAGYDQSQKLAALRKDSVFDVEFTADGDVTVRCHTDNFHSKPMPESMCGDGTDNREIETEAGVAEIVKESVPNWLTLTNTKISQSKTCKDLSSTVQSCPDQYSALRFCDVIVNGSPQSQCLAGSDVTLVDYYSDCISAVCVSDVSLLSDVNTYIADNCPGVDGLMEEAPGGGGEQQTCVEGDWIGSACSSDADCPDVAHSVCRLNISCSCVPGYFFSESSGCCVETCAEFSDKTGERMGYTISSGVFHIPDRLISHHTMASQADLYSVCYEPCAADPSCLTVTLTMGNEFSCSLYSATPRDAVGEGEYEEYYSEDEFIFQKRCK